MGPRNQAGSCDFVEATAKRLEILLAANLVIPGNHHQDGLDGPLQLHEKLCTH